MKKIILVTMILFFVGIFFTSVPTKAETTMEAEIKYYTPPEAENESFRLMERYNSVAETRYTPLKEENDFY